jgi:hypothetical protein
MYKPELPDNQAEPKTGDTFIFVVNLVTWVFLPGMAGLFSLIDGINTGEGYKFALAALGAAIAVGGWYFMRAMEQPKS